MKRRPSTLALADAHALASVGLRTSAVRVALAAAIVGAAVAAVALAPREGRAVAGTSSTEGTTVVVADLSSSISPAAYGRMAGVLRSLARPDRRVGLIAFSDTAYEMLPPGTSGEELSPLLRFFSLRRAGELQAAEAEIADTPWSGTFTSGTRISSGLELARRAIERDRVEDATVLLLSDLEDPRPDLARVAIEAERYRARGIELRVIPLGAIPANRSLFFPVLAPAAPAIDAGEGPIRIERPGAGGFPTGLVVAVTALLLLLAANESVLPPLRWRRP